MKKRVLIVSHALELGGAERSLIGLLHSLNLNKLDVDLFLLQHSGELMKDIPQGINLLPQIKEYAVLARPMKDTLKEGHIILTIARIVGKVLAAVYDKIHCLKDSQVEFDYSHKYTYRLMPQIQPEYEYDLAISFLTPHYICLHNVRAKKKIAWIHTDYSNVHIDKKSELKVWSGFDQIVSISDSVTKSFIAVFPELASRIILIENILPVLKIKSDASAFRPYPCDKALRLLSVGRYCYAKNFDNIPEICSIIKQKGINFCWYLIGYGPDEQLIRKKIEEYRVSDCLIMLGKQSNPYPYIADCDVYIQPSRYEGKSVSVREAQILGKPVIITKYGTALNQVENGIDGYIVSLDTKKCAEEIAEILKKQDDLQRIANNCLLRDYSGSEEVYKIYKMIL